jgi:hypothetical protein
VQHISHIESTATPRFADACADDADAVMTSQHAQHDDQLRTARGTTVCKLGPFARIALSLQRGLCQLRLCGGNFLCGAMVLTWAVFYYYLLSWLRNRTFVNTSCCSKNGVD